MLATVRMIARTQLLYSWLFLELPQVGLFWKRNTLAPFTRYNPVVKPVVQPVVSCKRGIWIIGAGVFLAGWSWTPTNHRCQNTEWNSNCTVDQPQTITRWFTGRLALFDAQSLLFVVMLFEFLPRDATHMQNVVGPICCGLKSLSVCHMPVLIDPAALNG